MSHRDWDLDVQVSDVTMTYLRKNMNHTLHHWESEDGRRRGDYLLDVNPFSVDRERGDGMNIIDARWIDVRSGLFVDITALSETHPHVAPGTWSCKNFHHYQKDDLYPLRESTFEGVPVSIPWAYDEILAQEYDKKALIVTEYEGHRWSPQEKEWIHAPRHEDDVLSNQAGNLGIDGGGFASRPIKPGLWNILRLVAGS